jgi:hypothetical protein
MQATECMAQNRGKIRAYVCRLRHGQDHVTTKDIAK